MTPKLDDYVNAFKRATDYIDATVMQQRAPLRERTVFTQAGKTVIHSQGERIIYGANGAIIARVTEDEAHNTHIEENERLHGIARPAAIRLGFTAVTPQASASASARPATVRASITAKGPK